MLIVAACGGGGDNTPAPQSTTVVGAAGGTVSAQGGASLVIPAAALSAPTSFAITQTSSGAPALPAGISAAGPMLAITPHGTSFAVPATVTVPFDPALVPAGATPSLYKTGVGQTAWELVAGAALSGNAMTAQVSSLSFFIVVQGLPPLTTNDPRYDWTFTIRPGNSEDELLVSDGTQFGGLLSEVEDFGPLPNADTAIPTFTQILPPDGIANGYLFAQGNGSTYGVFAEAPSGVLGTAEPIGGATRLTQHQTFVKNAADATLSFTLSQVSIEAVDYEAKFGFSASFIYGETLLAVSAIRNSTDYFFHTSGRAYIVGEADTWVPFAADESYSKRHLWDLGDFDFTTEAVSYDTGSVSCPGIFAHLRLKQPRTYNIDLSSVLVGEEFTVRSDAYAITVNRKGGRPPGLDCNGSSVRAFLRDPQSIGGTTWEYSGLTPTNNASPIEHPTEAFEPPAACSPGPGPLPEAGELVFSNAFYAVSEASGAAPVVTVTRQRGSVGAVTATIATSDVTAVAGTDYDAVLTTVYFGDGDVGPKLVTVPVIGNNFDQPDRTVLLTLSQPGGCAALGPLTSAVLTILDDDLPPTAPPAGALDTTFGGDGKVTLPGFYGNSSAMALQGDGKIVAVTGGLSGVAGLRLARFTTDGSLDTGFGNNGTVATSITGTTQQTARAVTIQSDGKIVVAGNAQVGSGSALALARYNSNGSLDPTFGTGGLVFDSAIGGIAYAVAIQPDGKIVVAGEGPINMAGPDYSDFQLARYDANGTLDASFGTGGVVAIDIGGTDTARNLVLLPDGKIVVSGHLTGNPSTEWPAGLARVLPNGLLDTTFGSGGTLRIDVPAVGRSLARQSDGKLLLAGSASAGVSGQLALMRLNADGSTDTSFGTAGLVTTQVSAFGDVAFAVALQADGRILLAGSGGNANTNFQLVRYGTDGSIDTTFGAGGRLVVDFGGFKDIADSIAVQSDGKIVLGGLGREGTDSGYGLVRINR